MAGVRTSHRVLKTRVRSLLLHEDHDRAMAQLADYPPRQVVNPLFSFFCSGDALLRWRAISGMGEVVSTLAGTEMESARVIMRRLMWTLNDESGGIGWGAPEAMGEITARHRGLADEFGCILVSYIRPDCNFLEHPVLQRGVLWGLGRLAGTRPEMVVGAVSFIQPFLISDDACHRGYAVWALRAVDETFRAHPPTALRRDSSVIPFFHNGRLMEVTITELTLGQVPPDGTSP